MPSASKKLWDSTVPFLSYPAYCQSDALAMLADRDSMSASRVMMAMILPANGGRWRRVIVPGNQSSMRFEANDGLSLVILAWPGTERPAQTRYIPATLQRRVCW